MKTGNEPNMKVIDSSAILNKENPDFSAGQYITIPEIREEIKDFRSKAVLELALDNREIKITEPSDEVIEQIKKTAKETGDLQLLSDFDLKVLALAYQEKATIITDDYDIQNMAAALGLGFEPVSMKIKKRITRKKYCKYCRKFSEEEESCEVCGNPLVLKAKRLENVI